MRNIVIVLLILGLIAPAMTVSAGTHLHEGNYAAGGSGFSQGHPSTGIGNTDSIIASTTGIHAMHAGDIVIDLMPLDHPWTKDTKPPWTPVDPETVNVSFDDFVTPEVAVYYSFHVGEPSTSLLGGGPHQALETGMFCNSEELERPTDPDDDEETATHLRLSVNAPSALDADVCPSSSGLATMGAFEVYHPHAEHGGPVQTHLSEDPWTPPFQ